MNVPVASTFPYSWGATAAEREAEYPCDDFAGADSIRVTRAVSCHAEPAALFAWLCQLRRGPYSYDVVDNLGRRSPRKIDRRMLDLRTGLRVMTIFRLVDFEDNKNLTLAIEPRQLAHTVFGPVALTYQVDPTPSGGSRLICALDVPPVGRVAPHVRRWLLSLGDFVMMRKQLLTLARLAERGAHDGS